MLKTHVIAVVVTHNRPRELESLLIRLRQQTVSPSQIIVVDNGLEADTAVVLSMHPQVVHLPSRRNLGGAGGFTYGIMHALALGAEHVWIMDDDGHPASADCLARLLESAERESYDMVSPIILDIDDPSRLAFYYYRNGRRVIRREQVAKSATFPQFAHLFNGALLKAETFERFGLPRYELFFRGDETDFLFRLNRDGARFATISDAAFLHPSGQPDALPIMGGRYHAIVPASPFARHYFFRNRGNLFREFGLTRALFVDLIRYAWAFGITRRGDWSGFKGWARTVRSGWLRHFDRPDPSAQSAAAGSGASIDLVDPACTDAI